MKQLNRKECQRILGKLSLMLPDCDYVAKQVTVQSGAELISQQVFNVEGKPVLANKTYRRLIPVTHKVNHENRLKTKHQSGGLDAVIAYCQGIIEAARQSVKQGNESEFESNKGVQFIRNLNTDNIFELL